VLQINYRYRYFSDRSGLDAAGVDATTTTWQQNPPGFTAGNLLDEVGQEPFGIVGGVIASERRPAR